MNDSDRGDPDWRDKLPPLSDSFKKAFQLERLLGEGGMGAVYLATQRGLDRSCALKLLKGVNGGDVERFRREGQTLGGLRHPGIVAVYDAKADGGMPYLVCELVEAPTLRARMDQARFTLAEALQIGRNVADALAYAHGQGVVHRDVKPENVFVFPDLTIKLGDFGLARETDVGHTLTAAGTVMGTPGYMAPEQVEGARPQPSTDQYAVGVMLFELVTGTLPFVGATPMDQALARLKHEAPRVTDRCPAAPASVADLVARTLSRPPEARFPAMADLVATLDDLIPTLGEAGARVHRSVSRVSRRTPAHGSPSRASGAAPPVTGAGPRVTGSAARLTGRTARTVAAPSIVQPVDAAAEPPGRGRLVVWTVTLAFVLTMCLGIVYLRARPAPGPASPPPSPLPSEPPVASVTPSPVPTPPTVAPPPAWASVPPPSEPDARCIAWDPLDVYVKRVRAGKSPADVANALREAARPLVADLLRTPQIKTERRYAALVPLRLVNHLCRNLRLPVIPLEPLYHADLRPDPRRPTQAVQLGESPDAVQAADPDGDALPFGESPLNAPIGVHADAGRFESPFLEALIHSSGEVSPSDLYWVELAGKDTKKLLLEGGRRLLTHSIPKYFLIDQRKVSIRVQRPPGLTRAPAGPVLFDHVYVMGRLPAAEQPAATGKVSLDGCWTLVTGEKQYALKLAARDDHWEGALCPPAVGAVRAWYVESGAVYVRVDWRPVSLPEIKFEPQPKQVTAELRWSEGKLAGDFVGRANHGQADTGASMTPASCDACK